jgi:hypothetical protein
MTTLTTPPIDSGTQAMINALNQAAADNAAFQTANAIDSEKTNENNSMAKLFQSVGA